VPEPSVRLKGRGAEHTTARRWGQAPGGCQSPTPVPYTNPLHHAAEGVAQVVEPRVAVAFFGDGATNIGTFHEALNLAQLWRVPAVFVCENNGYGEYTPFEAVTSAWLTLAPPTRTTLSFALIGTDAPLSVSTELMLATSAALTSPSATW